MKVEDIKKVCVVGGGLMGRQIALNSALYGYDAYVTDTNPAVIDDVKAWAAKYLDERVAKGKMTPEKADLGRTHFHPVPTLEEAAKDADLVIEAIIEQRQIKEEFFRNVDKLVRPDTILATNSSFMISSFFAGCVSNPSRLANFHYFNPALVMKLVEVVQGPHTSEETVQVLLDFARATGKDPIWVRKEIDGFIANRILRAVSNEALYLLEEGIATAQEIDTAAEKGLNYPMGPFRLMDLTGVDLSYLNMKRKLDETGVKSIGMDILKEKYEKKEWGRKTGKGWYDYTKK